MIVYSLKCAKNHEFEAWFRDSASYDAQCAKRAVTCPQCGSFKIAKAPMAPRLSKGRSTERAAVAADEPQPASDRAALLTRQTLETLRKQIEEHCDYVGGRFAEEARKIHYGETERRDIYGEASEEEARGLAEEGVEFHRVPWARRSDG